jgi:mono/diheme cytochrome c family protein
MMVGAATLAALFAATGSAAAAQAAQADRGATLFAKQQCTLCHSIGGKGNKAGALDGVGSELTADQIRKWIKSPKEMTLQTKATRKPPMKDYSNLAEADVDALVAYLSTLKKK